MPNPTPFLLCNLSRIENKPYKAYLKLEFSVAITTKDSTSSHIIIPNSIHFKQNQREARTPLLCISGFKKNQAYSLAAHPRAGGGLLAFLCCLAHTEARTTRGEGHRDLPPKILRLIPYQRKEYFRETQVPRASAVCCGT